MILRVAERNLMFLGMFSSGGVTNHSCSSASCSVCVPSSGTLINAVVGCKWFLLLVSTATQDYTDKPELFLLLVSMCKPKITLTSRIMQLEGALR